MCWRRGMVSREETGKKHPKHLHLWPNCHEEGLNLGLRHTISF